MTRSLSAFNSSWWQMTACQRTSASPSGRRGDRGPQGFKLDGRKVYLPMIGWVEFWHSRDIEGTVKNVTISRQGQHWCVAFQVEMDLESPVHPATTEVGIDLG